MLAMDQRGELAEFCTALNAGRTADFMEGLTDAEVWQVLSHAQPDRARKSLATSSRSGSSQCSPRSRPPTPPG